MEPPLPGPPKGNKQWPLSTTEAEFMAACAATKEAMWLRQLLQEINEYKQESVIINIDNQSAINVIKNSEFHKALQAYRYKI